MKENKQILLNYSKVVNEETKAVNETLCLNTTDIKKVTTDVPAEFVEELELLIQKYFG